MTLTSIAFKLAVSGSLTSLIALLFGSILLEVSDWYALFTCAIMGFTLMSWIVYVMTVIWS
jgi:hypothetical protein